MKTGQSEGNGLLSMASNLSKTRIIFIGAGALGRGYLPWMLDSTRHEFIYVERNKKIVDQMNSQGSFTTYRVNDGRYEKKMVTVTAACTPDDFMHSQYQDAVACFLAVGPGNVEGAAQILAGSCFPLILCENDPKTVDVAKKAVRHESVYFAVPDVISSNTAPPELLIADPLAITTESGPLYVETGSDGLHGDISFLPRGELLRRQWQPKFYLHNAPHCVAAYLGAIMGKHYIHEVMASAEASRIVEGTMMETLQMLKRQGDLPHEFLEWYAEKELARFRCQLLFDPVTRVARDPLRKLEPEGRLLGAAKMCLKFGVTPCNLLKGIVGAMLFDTMKDSGRGLFGWPETMSHDQVNKAIPGLLQGEALELMLRQSVGTILDEFQSMAQTSS